MNLTFIIKIYNVLKNAHHMFQKRYLDGVFHSFVDGLT
jgi:hypothetical protein